MFKAFKILCNEESYYKKVFENIYEDFYKCIFIHKNDLEKRHKNLIDYLYSGQTISSQIFNENKFMTYIDLCS